MCLANVLRLSRAGRMFILSDQGADTPAGVGFSRGLGGRC